jgi:restriction endonuclease Mrr
MKTCDHQEVTGTSIPQYDELMWPALPRGAVRDFRGAMAGRGEKGLLITTGSFAKDAQNEANPDGAPPVELIDGDRLCDLLKDVVPGWRGE